MEKEHLKDDFLSNLMKSSQKDKPGLDFTAKVMSDIQQLEAEKLRNPWLTWGNVLLTLGGIAALIMLYFVFFPFLGDSGLFGRGLDPELFKNYLSTILSYFQGFLSLIEFLKGSTITLIILLVIPMLVLLDHLLKRFSSRTYLFLF